MPKSDNPCAVFVDGAQCDATTEVLNYCRFHWRQQNRGTTFSVRRPRRPRGAAVARDALGRKQCARCEQWRDLEVYGPAELTLDRLQSWCRACTSDGALMRRYGITRAEVIMQVEEQGGCAMCGTPEPRNHGFRNGWHVDHDHACCPSDKTCGECIRGILCADCNKLIGLAGDSILRLEQAIAYLRAGGRIVEWRGGSAVSER